MSSIIPFPVEQLVKQTRRRILLIDDDADGVELLALLLQAMNQQTRVVTDSALAVQAAVEFDPDVIIIDLEMPKLSGFDLALAFRESPHRGEVGLFALSGWSDNVNKQRCREFGFDRFFAKPAPFAQICFALAEYPPKA